MPHATDRYSPSRPPRVTWLLCDYGEVLSLAQPEQDRVALAAAGGIDVAAFWRGYWLRRAPYDRGDVEAREYWSAVLGRSVDNAQVRRLVSLDVASWLHPNQESIQAVALAQRHGYRMALLSNAPIAVAEAISDAPWLIGFELCIFSCYLHLVKPEPAIYREALRRLDAAPEDVIFFDDRPDNIAAAGAIGIQAHLFTHAAQIHDLPPVSAE